MPTELIVADFFVYASVPFEGYITPAAWGPRCFRAGGKIRGGPQVGKVAT